MGTHSYVSIQTYQNFLSKKLTIGKVYTLRANEELVQVKYCGRVKSIACIFVLKFDWVKHVWKYRKHQWYIQTPNIQCLGWKKFVFVIKSWISWQTSLCIVIIWGVVGRAIASLVNMILNTRMHLYISVSAKKKDKHTFPFTRQLKARCQEWRL